MYGGIGRAVGRRDEQGRTGPRPRTYSAQGSSIRGLVECWGEECFESRMPLPGKGSVNNEGRSTGLRSSYQSSTRSALTTGTLGEPGRGVGGKIGSRGTTGRERAASLADDSSSSD